MSLLRLTSRTWHGARDFDRGSDSIQGRHKEIGTLVKFIEYVAFDVKLETVR